MPDLRVFDMDFRLDCFWGDRSDDYSVAAQWGKGALRRRRVAP